MSFWQRMRAALVDKVAVNAGHDRRDETAERHSRFARQDAYEAEGGAAGLTGKKREDCPYDKETEPDAWNFWVYGCENAQGEMAVLRNGYSTLVCSTAHWPTEDQIKNAPRIPASAAYRSGQWKPKYVTFPTTIHSSTRVSK